MTPKITKLKNGLTILRIPNKNTKALTVLILVKVGSRYEAKKINGVSHFVEHLMFKGTTRRPSTLDLSRELDKVGAEFNAYTGKDHTGYYIKVTSSKLRLALDLLSDMLYHSKFEADEIMREKGVILEEINMYEDNPLMYCESLLEELAFKNEVSLGQQISGPRKNIKRITRKEIVDYRNAYYAPNNMVLALAGNFDKAALKMINKYFGGQKKKRSFPKYPAFKAAQQRPRTTLFYKATEQVQIALGLPAYPYQDKRLAALNLLAIILGGNMSSRLFIKIREQMGLAYFVKADLNIYQDTGLFAIQAGLDKSRIAEALTEILEELKRLKTDLVDKKELLKAKTYIKGKVDLSLEDSSEQASWYAAQKVLTNKMESPAEKLKKINAVTPKQIQAVARELFKTKNINLALIGPFKEKNKFNKLLKI